MIRVSMPAAVYLASVLVPLVIGFVAGLYAGRGRR